MSAILNSWICGFIILIVIAIDASGNAISRDSSFDGRSRRSSSGHFGYTDTAEWGKENPDCSGSRQSPVDLSSYDMARLNVSTPFRWSDYDKMPDTMMLQNNGHSVLLSAKWNSNDSPKISGGVLDKDYTFYQLHFHWGPRDDAGSEHTINNHSLPMEMHMVHYKSEYGTMVEAKKHEDGLAVVGILFAIDNKGNRGISKLESHANDVKVLDSRVDVKPFPLSEFNVDFPGAYVAYLGSLTTPPCSEIVTWILPAVPRFVNHRQMNFFRNIQLADGGDHNYRPTMPRNGRMIYYISY